MDDNTDIVSLIHEGRKVQALIFLRQLLKAPGNVLRYLRRGVGRLLVEGQGDAVFSVELGVNLPGIVRDKHLCHILQPDGLHALHAQIKQDQPLQLLPGGNIVPHGNHVLHAVPVLNIARRHGKVLRRQQRPHGAQLQHIFEIRLLQGRGPALLQGSKARLQLGQGSIDPYVSGHNLLGAVSHSHGAACDLLHHARQNAVVLLELPDLFLQSRKLL